MNPTSNRQPETAPSRPQTRDRLPVLDGLRGFAALFVLIRHTSTFWGFHPFRSYLAVDLFFILSGFVISFSYQSRLLEGTLAQRDFYFLRLIRLYPVYLFSACLCAFIALFRSQMAVNHPPDNALRILGILGFTLIFLPFPFGSLMYPGGLFPLNSVFWSLFFELIANVSFAKVIQMKNWERAYRYIILCSFGALAFVAYLHSSIDLGFTWDPISFLGGTFRAMYGFFAGAILHSIYTRRGLNSVTASYRGVAIILVVCLAFTIPDLRHWNWIVDLALVSILFPCAVFLGASRMDGWISNALIVLGEISYPIYVFHKPIGELTAVIFKRFIAPNAPWSGLLFVLLLGTGSYYIVILFDIPLRRRIRTLLSQARLLKGKLS